MFSFRIYRTLVALSGVVTVAVTAGAVHKF
jgi:hypothetical protein